MNRVPMSSSSCNPWPDAALSHCIAACALGIFLTGCAWFQPNESSFTKLEPGAARAAFDRIAAATSGWHAAKFSFDCTFTAKTSDGEATHRASADCIWMPSTALRVRLTRLGFTVADIIYDGKRWYLSDEGASIVYICNRVDRIRVGNVQTAFLAYLQTTPNGWLPQSFENVEVAGNRDAVRFIENAQGARRTSIFPLGSATPSDVRIEAHDGATFTAKLSAPNTNVVIRPITFKPALAGYQVHDLDADTITNY